MVTNERIVAEWQENGMQYTITAKPINNTAPVFKASDKEMLSIFEYMGNRTPEKGTGDKVYKHARKIGAKFETKEVSTTNYTGKVMLYERGFLDVYFNNNTLNTVKSGTATPNIPTSSPMLETKTYEYDADNDDLPF